MTRILAILATTISLLPTFADADEYDLSVDRIWPNALYVEAEGTRYTRLGRGEGNNRFGTSRTVTLRVFLYANAGGAGRIRSWKVFPYVSQLFGRFDTVQRSLDAYAAGRSYSRYRDRLGSFNKTVDVYFPASVIEDLAVAACTTHAAELRRSGQSEEEIYSRRQTTQIYYDAGAAVDFGGRRRGPFAEADGPKLPWPVY